jgi:hypothetical protein
MTEPKSSRYLEAGSPICCFLCQTPFLGRCISGRDGHFYCSHECADKVDMTHVEPLRRA